MKPILAAVFVFLCIAASIWSARVGKRGGTITHKLASLFGRAALIGITLLFLAVVDAFTQVWVARDNYSGLPVLAASIFSGVALSIAIFSAAVAVLKGSHRVDAAGE